MGRIKRFMMHILCLQNACNAAGDRKRIAVIRKPRLGCMRGQREQAEVTLSLDVWRKLHEGRGELELELGEDLNQIGELVKKAGFMQADLL